MGDFGGEGCVWCGLTDGPSVQHLAERKLGSGRGTHANHPSKQSFFFPWEANVLVNGMTMCHSTTAFGHALDRTGHASWRTVSARYGRGHAKRHWWLKSNCPRLTYDRLRITAAIMWSGRGLHGMGMGTSWFACGLRISIEGGGIGASWPDPVALIPDCEQKHLASTAAGGKRRLRDGASSQSQANHWPATEDLGPSHPRSTVRRRQRVLGYHQLAPAWSGTAEPACGLDAANSCRRSRSGSIDRIMLLPSIPLEGQEEKRVKRK